MTPTEQLIAEIKSWLARQPDDNDDAIGAVYLQRLLTRVRELEAALAGMVAGYGHNFHTGSVALSNARAALAGPIQPPTEATR